MRIIIVADIVPTEDNIQSFIKGDNETLLDDSIAKMLKEADLRIANLETPLSDTISIIDKNGPCLCAPQKCSKGIGVMGFNLVTLANNHIMDQGVQGLQATLQALDDLDIRHVGVGKNKKAAAVPVIVEIEGIRIGVYACCETEFSVATQNTPGANGFDPLESLDHITELKSKCDYLIVLYHGGKEYYRYPSPYLKKLCHKLVDKGADAVICQHSHCIGSMEEYLDATIVYGQGNFLFNKKHDEYWKSSLIIQIDLDRSKKNVNYIPIGQSQHGVRKLNEAESQKVLNEFLNRSNETLDDDIIEQKYYEFAEKSFPMYVATFDKRYSGILYKIARKIVGSERIDRIINRRFDKKTSLKWENYITCEAHRELFLRGINRR
jgi:poly-gamma-glutamate synthesis protein (capsule biosynthesis protein)